MHCAAKRRAPIVGTCLTNIDIDQSSYRARAAHYSRRLAATHFSPYRRRQGANYFYISARGLGADRFRALAGVPVAFVIACHWRFSRHYDASIIIYMIISRLATQAMEKVRGHFITCDDMGRHWSTPRHGFSRRHIARVVSLAKPTRRYVFAWLVGRSPSPAPWEAVTFRTPHMSKQPLSGSRAAEYRLSAASARR